MRRFLNPFLAVLTALLLLGGQQAALAHMVGHIAAHAGGVEAASLQTDEDGHGAALTLSHVCTTCLAFAGADGAPPSQPPLSPGIDGCSVPPLAAVPPAPTFSVVAAYRSRAPPAL